jgi:hypothetical protein
VLKDTDVTGYLNGGYLKNSQSRMLCNNTTSHYILKNKKEYSKARTPK